MKWVTRGQIRVNRAAFLHDSLYAHLRRAVDSQGRTP